MISYFSIHDLQRSAHSMNLRCFRRNCHIDHHVTNVRFAGQLDRADRFTAEIWSSL